MDHCGIETGLFNKKPCGQAAVAHCGNCEVGLCIKHAMPQLTSAGKRTGKFMCKECLDVAKDVDKQAAAAAAKKPAAAKPAAGAAPAPAAAAAPGAKPAAPGAAKPAPAAKPAESDAIEFTPTKKPDAK